MIRRRRSSKMPPLAGVLRAAMLLGASLTVVAAAGLAVGTDVASAVTGPPEWSISVKANADFFIPGRYDGSYRIEAENVGGEATHSAEKIVIEDLPPAGTAAKAVTFYNFGLSESNLAAADTCASPVKCTYPEGPLSFIMAPLQPGEKLTMEVLVELPPGVEGDLEDTATVSGGGAAAPAEGHVITPATTEPPFGRFGFDASLNDSAGGEYAQAGGHPYQQVTEFNFGTYSSLPTEVTSGAPEAWAKEGTAPLRDPKEVGVELPPGLVANPQGVPRCSLADYFSEACEIKAAVGEACLRPFSSNAGGCREVSPVLNLEPQGEYPGQLGITIGGAPFIVVTTGIRTASDYGVNATAIAIVSDLNRVRLTLWGVPAEEAHDNLRGKECQYLAVFRSVAQLEHECEEEAGYGGGGPAEVAPTPFLTMPTECSGAPIAIHGSYNTWDDPQTYARRSVDLPPVDGCNNLSFVPKIEALPTTNLADSPTGLDLALHIPQNEDPEGVATPELKEAVVRLPAGLNINPASGEGLKGCSEAQVGLHSASPATCPDASKLGTVEVNTPLLHESLDGALYLATPHQNPSGSLLAGYLVLEGQGIKIKLPGEFETDLQTGQITARFLENPQLPFEDLKLNMFGGARGALRTPAVCGAYETTSELTPFSAPESGPAATPSAEFETTSGPTGGECAFSEADLPDAPRFHAGTETPQAGIYSPFSLRLVRDDGSQEVKSVETTLPKGLVGRLAGTSYCPEASIAAAEAKTGKEEQSSPSCPASSEVGTVDVGAGAGPTPLNVPGHVYLAGPYKGAPLSMAIITPAVAGPFDLGTVVVRAALHVDPETTQIHAVSDPIPTILEGIPLDVRSITMQLSKPDFTLNPTDCSESAFTGSTTSILDVAAPLTQRFQVGGCPALAFKPKLSLQLKGGTKRTKHPALTAVLKMPAGDANVAAAQVTLPHSDILDQGHIGTICTKVQFAANACPAKSVYGQARAFSPLLDQPLEGPVYLRSSSHELPDLVADLNGQIQVVLAGRVDAVHERLRTTFEAVPDAPVSKFVLQMQGGKKGLLQNKTDICRSPQRATVTFTAHNAKSQETNPALKVRCGGHHKKHKRKGGQHHA